MKRVSIQNGQKYDLAGQVIETSERSFFSLGCMPPRDAAWRRGDMPWIRRGGKFCLFCSFWCAK